MVMKLFPCGLVLTARFALAQNLGHGQHPPHLTMITSLPRLSALDVESADVDLESALAMQVTVDLHASVIFARTTAMGMEPARL